MKGYFQRENWLPWFNFTDLFCSESKFRIIMENDKEIITERQWSLKVPREFDRRRSREKPT